MRMVKGILDRVKRYVSVEAVFDEDGAVRPVSVIWEDGRRYEVDQVCDVRSAASLKVGGTGVRFTVRIGEKMTYLYYENPRWFVEAKNYGEFAGRA